MFANRIRLFKLLGFTVYLDPSWFLVAFLVAYSLATGYFPQMWKGLAEQTYWILGFCGTLGLFTSVVLHELGHSVVARKNGVSMRGITLFIFGGVAEMDDEPPSAKIELLIAIGGPLVSLVLAGLFFGAAQLISFVPARALLTYLAMMNSMLLLFNMVPAFPLDGGRVLRALLWDWKGSLRWATFISSRVGLIFANVLIGLGVLSLLLGGVVSALWWVVLGFFLRSAAANSYQQVLWREVLSGAAISRMMNTAPVAAGPHVSIAGLVEDYIYRYHHKMYPVVGDNNRLYGSISVDQIKEIPREEWANTSIGEVMEPAGVDNTIAWNTDALSALQRMSRSGRSYLMVVDGERLVGLISVRDLMSYISTRVELEGQMWK